MGTEAQRGTHGSRRTDGNTWEQRQRGEHIGTEAQRGTHGNRGTDGNTREQRHRGEHMGTEAEGNTCMNACDLWHVVA